MLRQIVRPAKLRGNVAGEPSGEGGAIERDFRNFDGKPPWGGAFLPWQQL